MGKLSRTLLAVAIACGPLVGSGVILTADAPAASASLPTVPFASVVQPDNNPLYLQFDTTPVNTPSLTVASESIAYGDGTSYSCSTPCIFLHTYGTGGDYTVTTTTNYTNGPSSKFTATIPVGVSSVLQGQSTTTGSVGVVAQVGLGLGRQFTLGTTSSGALTESWQSSIAGSIGVSATLFKASLSSARAVVGDASAKAVLTGWTGANITAMPNDSPARTTILAGAPLVEMSLPAGASRPFLTAGASAVQAMAAAIGVPSTVGSNVDGVTTGIGLTLSGSVSAAAKIEASASKAPATGALPTSGQSGSGYPILSLNLAGLTGQYGVRFQYTSNTNNTWAWTMDLSGQVGGEGPALSLAALGTAGLIPSGSVMAGLQFGETSNPDGTTTCSVGITTQALSGGTFYSSGNTYTDTLSLPCSALSDYASFGALQRLALVLNSGNVPIPASFSLNSVFDEAANLFASIGAVGATLDQTVTANTGLIAIPLNAEFKVLGVSAGAGVQAQANQATTWYLGRYLFVAGPGGTAVPVLVYKGATNPANLPTPLTILGAYGSYVGHAVTAAGTAVVSAVVSATTTAVVTVARTATQVVTWPFQAVLYWTGFGSSAVRRSDDFAHPSDDAGAPGVEVDYVNGGAPDPTNATISELMPGVEPATGPETSEGLTTVGPIYDIEDTSDTLTDPATVTITYPTSLLGSIDPSTLQIYQYSEGGWEPLSDQANDPGDDQVSATTDALGIFAVGVDQTTPTITAGFPAAGDLSGSSTIDADVSVDDPTTAEDDLAVVGSMDGGQAVPMTLDAESEDSFTAQFGPLSDGPHVLTVTSTGEDGTQTSLSIPFTVDTQVPDPPSTFSATNDPDGDVDLSFGAPADGTQDIVVERVSADDPGNVEELGDFTPAASPVMDDDFDPGQTYSYEAYSESPALVDSVEVPSNEGPVTTVPDGRPLWLAGAAILIVGGGSIWRRRRRGGRALAG